VILGIVNDTVMDRLHRSDSVGAIYRPITEPGTYPPGLLIRTANPAAAARAIEAMLQSLDSRAQPTTWVVRERLDSFLSGTEMLAWLAGPVAILAFLLAGFGVYGVMSFVVSQRKEEVSIRLAIGASATDILRLLVKDGLRPVIAGLATGLVGALIVTQLLAIPLSIDPFDPVAISAATATLMVGALLAVVSPARRAAKADPARVLRA
jgi:ABC-type lipoprotein release transport system permease subunit